jgi:hypothetical protein
LDTERAAAILPAVVAHLGPLIGLNGAVVYIPLVVAEQNDTETLAAVGHCLSRGCGDDGAHNYHLILLLFLFP